VRHAVLGGGGVGGLVAGALARAGEAVVLVLRPESVARHDGTLRVESVVLGDFDVRIPAAPALDASVDVLWVATKATQLERALAAAPPDAVGDALVVPFLNGIDHMALLRRRYPNVVAAAVRVESERPAAGVIRQKSPFLRVEMAGGPEAQAALRRAGIDCLARDDEATLLWDKLVFLAPVALATSAFDAPLGRVRDDTLFVGCRAEAVAAARAAGADVDTEAIRALHETAPAEMQSSMQKDVAARREPELDAIAGPIIRRGRDHGFETTATETLATRVRRRLA
jgi:2-dehydropantoate 2-reductase